MCSQKVYVCIITYARQKTFLSIPISYSREFFRPSRFQTTFVVQRRKCRHCSKPHIYHWRLTVMFAYLTIIEPHRDKTNKMACAPSEDSDQPGHPPSVSRVFPVRLKKARILSYPLRAQRMLTLGGCPGWSESSLGAHAILLVLSWGGSFYTFSSNIALHYFFSDFRSLQPHLRSRTYCN